MLKIEKNKVEVRAPPKIFLLDSDNGTKSSHNAIKVCRDSFKEKNMKDYVQDDALAKIDFNKGKSKNIKDTILHFTFIKNGTDIESLLDKKLKKDSRFFEDTKVIESKKNELSKHVKRYWRKRNIILMSLRKHWSI